MANGLSIVQIEDIKANRNGIRRENLLAEHPRKLRLAVAFLDRFAA